MTIAVDLGRKANKQTKQTNKGADQSARMRRLVFAFFVRRPPKAGFLASRPSYNAAYQLPLSSVVSILLEISHFK